MNTEEIKKAAIEACKNYGYQWVMADFQYDDSDEFLKDLESQMKDKGYAATQIFDGEEPYYALEWANVDDDIDMVDVMEDGEVFSEGDVYNWINLGRIEAWKEVFNSGKKKVGYFCDGYGGYVFYPERMDVNSLKMRGKVVVA